ncbi:multidrug effflux MFS transporter [Sphingomonas sp. AP4-R1]|uniref:multidrug effflux MFS transporter n=1 Tax=Sphingomonas sp. AP4-R1 TaxID=2735134 RepID=UPI0015989693|nr:multidrug effflux MFS transporter [Sphingomonas sp. AP4-R1]QJU57377.1 multidrug effflux MFS transporter [Sphingomonas sp. AP4-R1]
MSEQALIEVGAEEMITTKSTDLQDARRHGWRTLAILSALMGFASISTDLYLPAMPAMARTLGADTGQVEWTVSGYLIGFSLGQLLWGPIGDRFGRRLPVAIGLVLFVIGSTGCAASGGIGAMIAWRIVQATGACASVVLARAMVRDLYSGDQAARMLSTLIMVMAVAPLLGPVVGGEILAVAGWRAIFWALVGFGILTLGALMTLPETLPPAARNRQPMGQAFQVYGRLLRDSRLLAFAGASAFLYGGMYAYVAGTPFAYISYHHVPARLYGLLFAIGVVGLVGANMVNVRLVGRVGGTRLLMGGCTASAVAGLATLLAAWNDWGGVWGLVVPLFVVWATAGFIVANSISGAMADHPKTAGAVSALVGAMQYGTGIVGSGLVGALADGTPRPMAAVIAICGIGCLISARLIRR